VEHRLDAFAGAQHRVGIGEIAAQLLHAQHVQFRVIPAIEAGDLVAALDQPAAQRLAEETATTGYKDAHAGSEGSWGEVGGRRRSADV
jgi:hypothetical protein